ncbi:MAG: peroxiredoxin [Myxococcales bacterium]|nr:peroxiredoxin [Myxococcales bacterium]
MSDDSRDGTIQLGIEAPDFELPSSLPADNGKPGRLVRLSSYRGERAVVLAFYPLDFSPVCSGENACFQKSLRKYEEAGAQVLGISVDSEWCHAAFAKELGLAYPLLADFHPKGEVAKKYGLYLEEWGISARATVVVDRAGVVRMLKVQQIPEPRENERILAFVASLQTT